MTILKILAVIAIICLLVFLFLRKVWFYRDPVRKPPAGKNLIISPADGQVIYIKPIKEGTVYSEKLGHKIALTELSKLENMPKKGWLVGIYMSPLDVHYNYAPVAAKVEKIVHTQAKVNLPMVDLWEYINIVYLRRAIDLFDKKFHFQNERNTLFIKNDDLEIVIVEIADKFVNKIRGFVKEGETLTVGQKIGFIERGSQVDLVIYQENLDFKIKVGQQVYGAKTIIAKY